MTDLEQRRPTNEIRGLGDLAGLALERFITPAEGTHRAVAERAFRMVGEVGQGVRIVHNAVSDLTYGSIKATTSAVAFAVGGVGTLVGLGRPFQPVTGTRSGTAIVSAINGLWGDELERRGNDLSISMAVRDERGEPVPINPAGIVQSFPDPTGRLVIFVHGLAETERFWGEENSLGELLASGHGFTPLRLRYNTGLPIPENGRQLATLLHELVEAWPIEVDEVVLVGHSMGGLVARSAAHAGHASANPWIRRLAHIVTLGSPHLGAPLEKGVHALARVLHALPESRSFATFLDSRSRGIKDLRHGTVVAQSAVDSWLDEAVGDVVIPPHVSHHFVAGVVTTDPRHPLGVLVGDFFVRPASGTAQSRRVIEATNTEVLGGRNHFNLLNDPEINERVAGWIGGARRS